MDERINLLLTILSAFIILSAALSLSTGIEHGRHPFLECFVPIFTENLVGKRAFGSVDTFLIHRHSWKRGSTL